MLVYCKDCKWVGWALNFKRKCKNPVTMYEYHNPYESGKGYYSIESLNSDNNCQYFTPKKKRSQ